MLNPERAAAAAGPAGGGNPPNTQTRRASAPAGAVAAWVATDRPPPMNTWRINLREHLPGPDAGGFHLNEHHQPYAAVDLNLVGHNWPVTVSHELLEMLADPWGNRMHSAAVPEDEAVSVLYLLEI